MNLKLIKVDGLIVLEDTPAAVTPEAWKLIGAPGMQPGVGKYRIGFTREEAEYLHQRLGELLQPGGV